MLSEKKYPGDPKAMQKMQSKLTVPTTHPGATVTLRISHHRRLMLYTVLFLSLQKVAGNAVLDRMTDTSKYTGSHKLRFDESGKGKGLDGRDSTSKGPGHIPALVSAQSSYVAGNTIGLDAVDSERAKDSPRAKAKAAAEARASPKIHKSTTTTAATKSSSPQKSPSPAAAAKSSPRVGSKTGASSPATKKPSTKTSGVATSSPKSSPASKPKVSYKKGNNLLQITLCTLCLIQGDIYNKLTDTSKYTASHKHRFDDTGRGKGLGGRDAPAKGAAMTPSPASNLTSYVAGYKHENTYGK